MNDEIETFLLQNYDLVIINIWEPESEPCRKVEMVLREFARIRGEECPPLIRLDFSENKSWAMAHGIFGTPATLVFSRGKPLFRLLGRFNLEELLGRLSEEGF